MVIEILRYIIIFQAAWVLGAAIIILPAYTKDRYFAHISLIATSYTGLVLLATFRSFAGEPILSDAVYVPIVAVLLLLGDISLLILLKRRRSRRIVAKDEVPKKLGR